ncbi:MAG: carboxypeptidase regulatory-like domain-containing protein [Candidatus Thermoplasmatota archaeon]
MRLKKIFTFKSNNNLYKTISVILVLLSYNFSIQLISAEPITWDDEWNFSQEINIPIDTTMEASLFQPVDIKIEFDENCWARNENQHSIRVVSWDGNNWHELESQIYDLEKSNDNFINSCGLVFLIPEFADGNEKYYVYYSDTEKDNPDYEDHVQIEESYYHYEPISGYALESSFFKITDDGYCNYIVSQEGQFMGYNTGQHITKMIEKTTEIKPKNGDPIASFDFKYSYGEDLFDYSSTSQKLISKDIVNDGNLMIEFGMISKSKLDDLQTTANYKYYHCPSFSKTRIHVHIKHEALEDISLNDVIILDTNTDGTYATLQTQAVKSKTIDDLNFGEIQPYLHFNNEINTLTEFEVDTDPDYIPEDLDIRIISIIDDVDLGENSWVSFDEGEKGIAHAIIFYSNDVVLSGDNERNGLQINSFEMDYPHLPGLENNMANIVISRNSFEKDENLDTNIPKGFVVEFDAEYFSTKNDGYKILDDEATIFRKLVENKPEYELDINNEIDEKRKHTLSINVHRAPSFPMGSSLSAIFGKNFSYISAELYEVNEYVSSESAVRLPMKAMDDFDSSRIIRTMIQSLKFFDYRNSSFYKKIIFSDIEEGEYIVKIFRENSVFSMDKQYIGYAIVNLNADIKIDINCRSEGQLKLLLIDQNENVVENAQVFLKINDLIIADSLTDQDGITEIKAPKNSNDYSLEVFYKGFLVYEESVKLNFLNNLRSDAKSIEIERYIINLEIFDKWDLSPDVELNPIIVNNEINDQIIINSEKNSDSNYVFNDIPPGDYQIMFRYKSFIIEESIKLNEDKNVRIEFPAEFKINIKVRDSRGIPYQDSIVYIERDGKKIKLEDNIELTATLPPGEYILQVHNDEDIIYKKNINIYNEGNFDIVTNHDSMYPIIFLAIFIILIGLVLVYSYLKKNIKISLTFLPIIFVFISLLFPWWIIQGSSNQISSTSSMFLYPMNLITLTTSSENIVGELAFIPDLFILVINIFLIISFIGCIITSLSYYFDRNNNKKNSLISLFLGLITFSVSISMFIFALNELASIAVGSIIGQGNIDSTVIQNGVASSVYSNWGFGIGFYIYFVSLLLIIANILYFIRSNKGEEVIWGVGRKKSKQK